MWFIYNILFTIGFALTLPHYLMRMRRRGGYRRNFWERIGRYDAEKRARLSEGGRIWVHGVSVGEVYVALKCIESWRRDDPEARFILSVTTSTGHAVAEKNMDARDVLMYFPVDFPLVTRKVLDVIRPRALLLMETELWPNIIRAANRRSIPVAIANGRLSDHSYRGYLKLRAFTRRLLPLLSLIGVQSDRDRERMIALGAPEDRTAAFGSAKYDVAVSRDGAAERAGAILKQAGMTSEHIVLLGGSTWPGEEAALVRVFHAVRGDHPALRLVIAPRHVERMPRLIGELNALDVRFMRRSAMNGDRADILLVDTTGELQDLYAGADIVFIGKSLCARGGQNPLEAAVCGKPLITGPNMQNFFSIMEDLREADAVMEVQDEDALRDSVRRLAADPNERAARGRRAAAAVSAGRGAVDKTVRAFRETVFPNLGS